MGGFNSMYCAIGVNKGIHVHFTDTMVRGKGANGYITGYRYSGLDRIWKTDHDR